MKYSYQSIVTPSKLINPFHASIKPKKFKPLRSYLEFSKITPKFLKDPLQETDKNKSTTVEIVDLYDFSSPFQSTPKSKSKRFVNKSCKLRKALESNHSSAINKFEIPAIHYKSFEPFHLPSVKVKPKLKVNCNRGKFQSLQPRQEEVESAPSQVLVSPKLLEVTEYSKELRDKIQKVKEIVKNIENEFL